MISQRRARRYLGITADALRGPRFLADLYLKRDAPVLVYQMGKVSSTSVARSVRAAGFPRTFQIMRMNDEARTSESRLSNRWRARLMYDRMVKSGVPLRVVTLARDPFVRNMSSFFENIYRYAPSGHNTEVDALQRIFIERFPHDYPTRWFDIELRRTLGVDVYDHPFDAERGASIVREGRVSVLVLRVERPDTTKEQALAELLGLDRLELLRANDTEDKRHAATYREFRETIHLPPAISEMLLESRYTRHFFSEPEIEGMRARWLGSGVEA